MTEWKNQPKNINDYVGFIYIIRNHFDDKFYIGQKKFWKKVNRAVEKKITKAEQQRRDKLQLRYDSGEIKTIKVFKEELRVLKISEKERRSNLKIKTKKVMRESDWQKYWGSNDLLKEDVKSLGEENFSKEILICCETKGMMNYAETFLQMKYGVVFDDDSYNGLVNIRANTKMFQNYQTECKNMLEKLNRL